MPCVRAAGGDATADGPTVEEIRATAEFEDERFYRIERTDGIEQFLRETIDHEGVIPEAAGRAING